MCVFQNPVAVTMLGWFGWNAVLDAPNARISTDAFIESLYFLVWCGLWCKAAKRTRDCLLSCPVLKSSPVSSFFGFWAWKASFLSLLMSKSAFMCFFFFPSHDRKRIRCPLTHRSPSSWLRIFPSMSKKRKQKEQTRRSLSAPSLLFMLLSSPHLCALNMKRRWRLAVLKPSRSL